MFLQKDIIDIEIENTKYSAIAFNNKTLEIPSFLLQGEKKPGYLFKDGTLSPWYWEGFVNYEGKKCLYFAPIKLIPLSQIASTHRNEAPKLIANLANALSKLDLKFLDLQNGIISSWRIFFTEDNGVLILPSNLGDLFSATSSDQRKFSNTNSFIHADILPSFTLIDQMTQLLYFSITAIKPFEYQVVRTNGYNAIDLTLLTKALNIDVDSDLVDKINKILHISVSKIRDISSNLAPQEALKWYIERFSDLTWDLENVEDKNISIDDLLNNETIKPTIEKMLKKSSRIIFWRKKGAIIITVSIISILVLSFVGSRIHEALQPPYTADLNQEGIINAYYQAQNELSVENLEASLKRGVKSPITNEVTTLFVTKQTRMAYEYVDSIINPGTWVDQGMPPIESSKMIYGVSDLSITQIGDNQYMAESTYYSPYPITSQVEQENLENTTPSQIYTGYRFNQKEIFTFEYNNRGWYEISDISDIDSQYLDTIKVPTYSSSDTSYDINSDNRKTEIIIEPQYL